MSERSYEQLRADAYQRLLSIREAGETPAECHFRVSHHEYLVLLDHPPAFLPEMNGMRTTIFGMPITVTP